MHRRAAHSWQRTCRSSASGVVDDQNNGFFFGSSSPSKFAFPLLLLSDCVPPIFTRSLSCTLLSPTSGENSKSSAEYRLAVDTGAFSITTFGLHDFAGATL